MFQLLLPMNKSVLVMVELVLVKVVQLLVAMTLPMEAVIVYRNQVLLLDQVDLPMKRHVLVPLLIQEHVREHLSAANKMLKVMTNVLKLLVAQDVGLTDFLLKENVISLVVETLLNVAIMLAMVVAPVLLILYHMDNLEQDLLILYKNVWLMLFVKHHLLSVVGMVEQMTKVVFQLVFLEVLIEILVVLQDILMLPMLQLLVVVILDLIAMEELVPLKLMFQLLLPMNKHVLTTGVKVILGHVAMTLPTVVVIVFNNQVPPLDQVDLPLKQNVLELSLLQELVKEHLLNVMMPMIVVPKSLVIHPDHLLLLVEQDIGMNKHVKLRVRVDLTIVLVGFVLSIPYHLVELVVVNSKIWLRVWLMVVKVHLSYVVGKVDHPHKAV
jgi:hypothetical protein